MSALSCDTDGIVGRCSGCGQRFRLKYETLDKPARCVACKTEIPAPTEPVEIKSAPAFDAALQRSSLPLIVDFWAGWCGPCLMMAPELKKVAAALAGRALVLKVNAEDRPELSARYRIASLPTLSFFSQGRELNRIMGARPAKAVLDWAAQLM